MEKGNLSRLFNNYNNYVINNGEEETNFGNGNNK